MRKVFGKVVACLSTATVLCLSATGLAYADDYNSHTGYKNIPKLQGGSSLTYYQMAGYEYDLTTSSKPAKGTEVKTYFQYDGKKLSNDFAYSSSRKTKMTLYEVDTAMDDTVKTYNMTFNGRNVKSVVLSKTNTSGTIEPFSKEIEVKMNFVMDFIKGDKPYQVGTGVLGKYDIRAY